MHERDEPVGRDTKYVARSGRTLRAALVVVTLLASAAACTDAARGWDSASDVTLRTDVDSIDVPTIDVAVPCGIHPCGAGQVCVRPCGCDPAVSGECGHCTSVPAQCEPLPDCECLDVVCPVASLGCATFDGESMQCACSPPLDASSHDAAPDATDDAPPPCSTLPQAMCRIRPDCLVRCQPRCGCVCPDDACGCTTCVGSCFFFLGCDAR